MQSTTISEPEMNLAAKADERAYLVFHLGREEFGIRALKVRQIMGL